MAEGTQVFQVSRGDILTIDSFGIFGNEDFPADPLALDTLRFSGIGLVASNLLLRQIGVDVLVTFSGVPDTSVTLTSITIEQLENIAGAGNFQFDGEAVVTDGVDIWSASQQSTNLSAPNRATFLNDLPSQVSGLDASNDVINGQGGNDQLHGLSGNDLLRGGGGNDLLDSGAGNDRLEGGTGNDIYVVDSLGDQIVEVVPNSQDGGWSDEVRSSISFSLGTHANIERLTLTGTLAINGTGNSGHNVIVGNNAANTLNGGSGNDVLAGGNGADMLNGGSGADRMEGGRGSDIYIVDSTSDVVTESMTNANAGGWSDEVRSSIAFDLSTHINIEGLRLTGAASINGSGNSGHNFLFGNIGDNVLRGRNGNDRLLGGDGNDLLDGGRDADTLTGGNGDDVIDGGDGKDITVYSGNFAGYTFSQSGASFFVQDQDAADGDDGNDFVSNVEILRFKDREIGTLGPVADGSASPNQVLEGSADGTTVGITVTSTHSLGESIAFSLTDTAGGRFTIDPTTGVVTVDNGAAIDFETTQQHSITARATDPTTGLFREQTFQIAVLDILDEDVSIIDLADLNSNEGIRIIGAVAADRSGYSLSSAGDFNGDGLDDIIVGANKSGNGEAHVVFGRSGGGTIDLATLSSDQDFRITGIGIGDATARSVSDAGDINGDGLDDIVIGAPFADGLGRYNSGQAHVIYGGSAGDVDLETLDPSRGFSISGPSDEDVAGISVSGAGDVNGDGIADLVIGGIDDIRGQAFIVYGAEGGLGNIDLGQLTPQQGFRILGNDDHISGGFTVSTAGDFNGDGLDDVIVGSESERPNNRLYAGESYVIFGQQGGGGDINLETLSPGRGFRISGASEYDFSGLALSGAGDINGDGFSDIFVGAPAVDENKHAYVIYGRDSNITDLDLGTISNSDGFRIVHSGGELEARSISIAGDINGDGLDDLILNAPAADPEGRRDAGATYVIYGRDDLPNEIDLATLTAAEGFKVIGAESGDMAGHAVTGAGDVNGDGFDDLAIGAMNADPGGRAYAGETYIIYGGDFGSSALDVADLLDDAPNGRQEAPTTTLYPGLLNVPGAELDASVI